MFFSSASQRLDSCPCTIVSKPGFVYWLSYFKYKPTSSSHIFYFQTRFPHVPSHHSDMFLEPIVVNFLEPQLDPSGFQVLLSLDSYTLSPEFFHSELTPFLWPQASICKTVVTVREKKAKWPTQKSVPYLDLINLNVWVTELNRIWKSYTVKNISILPFGWTFWLFSLVKSL